MDRKRLQVAGIVAAVVAVVATDFALGVSGIASWVMTALQLVAVVPWAGVVLARTVPGAAPSSRAPLSSVRPPSERAGRSYKALLVNLVFVALLLGALAAKGLLLAAGSSWPARQLDTLYRTYVAMACFVAALGFAGRGHRTAWFFATVAEHPARMLITSLTIAALLGAFLLSTPFALVDPTKGNFIDALFDATGALCGSLSASDVGRHYAFFGQAVVLGLIQLGGFGIMVLSASIPIFVGRKMEVKSAARFAEIVDADSLADLRAVVRGIILWTVAIEIVGAVCLFFLFDLPGIDAHPSDANPLAGGGGAAWSAVFHSVSAFCNAGFALFRGNLAPFVNDFGVNVVICGLILLGGIGFPVLRELAARFVDFVSRTPRKRLSLHARIALAMTGALVVAGALPLLVLEWERGFAKLPVTGKLLAAFFQSITARSAGFGSVDFTALSPASLLVLVALMFVGAAPGSTGGGIKVTTLAVLVATFRAEQTSATAPTLFGREIPNAIQRKAIVVTFLSAILVVTAVFAILVFEDAPPLFVLFDVTSAFGSAGCSTGIEDKMGAIGKLLLILTMIIGRVGPLTFALAAASKPKPTVVRLPEERVMIG